MSTMRVATVLLLAATACALSPVSRRIGVGQEPYLIFVGEGRTGDTDLFATTTGGGEVFQVTFNHLAESSPRLDPTGVVVAFLRETGDAGTRDLVFLNLQNGAERTVPVAGEGGPPERLGWSRDGNAVYVRHPGGIVLVQAPPGEPAPRSLPEDAYARADSALGILLGNPPFARVLDCETGDVVTGHGRRLCTEGPDGLQHDLVDGVTDPLRWGDDSVAWFRVDHIEIRPLGPGLLRRLTWSDPPAHPRDADVFLFYPATP